MSWKHYAYLHNINTYEPFIKSKDTDNEISSTIVVNIMSRYATFEYINSCPRNSILIRRMCNTAEYSIIMRRVYEDDSIVIPSVLLKNTISVF